MGAAYDVLTAPDPSAYSVPMNRKSVGDGNVAVIYRVDVGAYRRDPGQIVAIARVTSSPWFHRNGFAEVNWDVQLLPPESWISSADMQGSGFWVNRVPFSSNTQVSSPVELNQSQWGWITSRLPAEALKLLEAHAKG